MKKKVILTLGAMTIAAVIGLVFSQQVFTSADPDLTIEDVRKQVEAQYPGRIMELELENEGKEPIYEIELAMEGQEYELRIDANSGKVIRLNEKLTASKQEGDLSFEMKEKENTKEQEQNKPSEQANNKEESNQTKSEEAPKQSESDNKQTETTKDGSANERNTMISREKAIEIAQEQFNGKVDDIELEEDDGKVFYEIEIESSKGDAEIEIDAFTGKVLMVDIDLEDD